MTAGIRLTRRSLLLLLLALPLFVSAAPDLNKVVFHLNSDDPEQQETVLRNLDNHIAAVGAEQLDIKVLLHGGGVTLLLLPEALPHTTGVHRANATPDVRRHVDALRAQGEVFLDSARTLTEHGIDFTHDLHGVSKDQVVANALSCLSELQRQGYAYIKP